MKLDEKWRQVGGDQDPGRYGCVLARAGGDAIELLEIQPVREHTSKGEAAEVGYPFWSREAYYSPADLVEAECQDAIRCAGLESEGPISPLEIALAKLAWGEGAEDGPAGWAREVFPEKAYYWCNKRPLSGAAFADEDREFRLICKEQQS
jgi:hypothetical protein